MRFGLTSVRSAKLIKKPWKVATNMPTLHQQLSKYTCSANRDHAPCEGSDTKLTENYTVEMTRCIHNAFKAQLSMQKPATNKQASIRTAAAVAMISPGRSKQPYNLSPTGLMRAPKLQYYEQPLPLAPENPMDSDGRPSRAAG